MDNRRLGLEQEFFVVDPNGDPSNRADELVRRCQEIAPEFGFQSCNFAAEWVKNILEINTPPVENAEVLAKSYYGILYVALQAARHIDVRLYPYSVYPLHLIPVIRDEVNYHVQVRTVGHERFLNAGKCTGTHMHLEAPAGIIDSQVGVSYNSTEVERQELLNTYNLATALDPVMIALSRASPFYEGQSSGLAHRTARYRGNADYGWEGVYTLLPKVGSLRPYAESIEHLVQLQFDRHYAWMNALDAAHVERSLFHESGGNILKSSWNPVRLNCHGTVELRNIDSNMPEIVLGVMLLVQRLHHRVRKEKLQVTPTVDCQVFEICGDKLLVPEFDKLHHQLLYAAVTEGIESPYVGAYTASALEFANYETDDHGSLNRYLPSLATFHTTEISLLERFCPQGEMLSRESGLQLVREACDELERRVQEFNLSDTLIT